MKTKQLIEKKYIIAIFITFFLLFNVPMALAKTKSLAAVYLLLLEFGPDQEVPKDPLLLTVYLPAILAASVEREEVDMHGYKYVYTMPYKGPIQIAPAGQQGNSHYYYFLYRMPKGQYGCATFGSKFLIEYPTGKDGKTFTKEITNCNKDWGIRGAWYRKGNCTQANDGHYHKEVFSMEVYYGADGEWKSTPEAERKNFNVRIYNNKKGDTAPTASSSTFPLKNVEWLHTDDAAE